jgi:hypothetical protein
MGHFTHNGLGTTERSEAPSPMHTRQAQLQPLVLPHPSQT